MPSREGARRTLTVDEQFTFLAIYRVFFKLADVMRHIVDELQAEFGLGGIQKLHERLTDEVHNALPIVPCVVRAARHRRDVILSLFGVNRCGGELPVWQVNAVSLGDFHPTLDVLIANLIAEPARTGVNHDADFAFAQPHHLGCLPVKNPIYHLDFKEVISRAECAELVFAALQGALTCGIGVRVLQKSGGFGEVQIVRVAVVALNCPKRALL